MSTRKFIDIYRIICGKIRIEKDDSLWIDLFQLSYQEILTFNNAELTHLNYDFIANNYISNNLLQLAKQACSRLQQLTTHMYDDVEIPRETTHACCNALYIFTLSFHFFLSHTHISNSSTDFQRHLNLTYLIDNCLLLIIQYHTQPSLHDAVFLSMNLIIVSFSTMMYMYMYIHRDRDTSNTEGGDHHMSLFLDYVLISSDAQIRKCQMEQCNGFQSLIPVRLLKSLLHLITTAAAAASASKDSSSIVHCLQEKFNGANNSNYESDTSKVSTTTNITVYQSIQSALHGFLSRSSLAFIQSLFQHPVPPPFPPPLAQEEQHNIINNESNEHITAIGDHSNAQIISNNCHLTLASRALSLLNLLIHSRRVLNNSNGGVGAGASIVNPFRELIGLLSDESSREREESEEQIQHGGSSHLLASESLIYFKFSSLTSFLSSNLPEEGAALLLYSLLHHHPTFLSYLYSTESESPKFGVVLSLLLKGLYEIKNSVKPSAGGRSTVTKIPKSMDHYYVLIVCVLIITSDRALLPTLCKTFIPAPWYKERHLHKVPLSDLLVLVIIRVLLYSYSSSTASDSAYLVSSSLAVLCNVAPHCCEVQYASAERLLSATLKVFDKTSERHSSTSTGAEIGSGLSRAILVMLRPSVRLRNVHVLYAVLHALDVDLKTTDMGSHVTSDNVTEEEMMVEMFGHVNSLAGLGRYYLDKLEKGVFSTRSNFSANEAVEALKKEIYFDVGENAEDVLYGNTYNTGNTGTSTHTYCTYEEAPTTPDFFIPYSWTCLVKSSPDMEWSI